MTIATVFSQYGRFGAVGAAREGRMELKIKFLMELHPPPSFLLFLFLSFLVIYTKATFPGYRMVTASTAEPLCYARKGKQ